MAYARAFEATGVCHTPLHNAGSLGITYNSRALSYHRALWTPPAVSRYTGGMTAHEQRMPGYRR